MVIFTSVLPWQCFTGDSFVVHWLCVAGRWFASIATYSIWIFDHTLLMLQLCSSFHQTGGCTSTSRWCQNAWSQWSMMFASIMGGHSPKFAINFYVVMTLTHETFILVNHWLTERYIDLVYKEPKANDRMANKYTINTIISARLTHCFKFKQIDWWYDTVPSITACHICVICTDLRRNKYSWYKMQRHPASGIKVGHRPNKIAL